MTKKTIEPIAIFHSPFATKFGIPRQSGLVGELRGVVELLPQFRAEGCLRGLEAFDYLWLVWGFSANEGAPLRPTVRPPRLGGNRRMGVFATRSPFRPNGLGLSSVRIVNVRGDEAIDVAGADLMDGTPIYDIKPYVAFTDSHREARSGFVDTDGWQTLAVVMPAELRHRFSEEQAEALVAVLAQDPRPAYHDEPDRVYGMPFCGRDVRFTVSGLTLTVVAVEPLQAEK